VSTIAPTISASIPIAAGVETDGWITPHSTLSAALPHVARAEQLRREGDHDLDRVWRHHSLIAPAVAVVASGAAFLHPAITLVVLTAESAAVFMTRAPRTEPAASWRPCTARDATSVVFASLQKLIPFGPSTHRVVFSWKANSGDLLVVKPTIDDKGNLIA
jgi:hypothetical protein